MTSFSAFVTRSMSTRATARRTAIRAAVRRRSSIRPASCSRAANRATSVSSRARTTERTSLALGSSSGAVSAAWIISAASTSATSAGPHLAWRIRSRSRPIGARSTTTTMTTATGHANAPTARIRLDTPVAVMASMGDKFTTVGHEALS